MPAPGVFDDLDPKIATALRRIVEDLRAEFRQWLGGSAPVETSEADGVEELKLALTVVDRATSQAEVLSALLQGARRFASRAALFVTRADTLDGWAGLGFENATTPLGEVGLRLEAGTPWERVVRGAGTVALAPQDCAPLCGELGVPAPAVGSLVPLMLGERIAAALYCDRLEGDGSLRLSALQILAYCAAQTLETLPVRNRTETVTLRLGGEAGPEPGTSAAPLESEPEPTMAVATPREGLPVSTEGELLEEEVELDVTALDTEAEIVPLAENVPEFEFDSEPAPMAESASSVGAETVVHQIPEALIVEPAAPEPEEPAAAEAMEPTAVSVPPSEPMAPEPEPIELPPAEPAAPLPEEPLSSAGFETTTLPTLEEIGLQQSAPATPGPREEVTSPIATIPASAPEAPAEGLTAKATDPGRAGAAVEPPKDVEGPGWAFTSRDAGGELGEEAKHEEARRLARLLVTEIKLYNEEQVEAGRIQRDIFDRLRDDIERSRQIFDDRVDPEIRAAADHFHEALVRILGGGDPATLGR